MKKDEGSLSGIYSVSNKLPRWGECVAVVTPYFHCRGILDHGGEWHHMDGSVIENVQSWYLVDADEVEFGSPLPT